jgi:hypothetical protein
VFKSFQGREAVYRIISGYCPCTQIDNAVNQPLLPEPQTGDSSESEKGCDDVEEPIFRSRTTSESSIRTKVSETDSAGVIQNELPEIDKTAIWEAIKSLSSDWNSSVTVRWFVSQSCSFNSQIIHFVARIMNFIRI